jgi:AcrR family transcriptional regulator
MVMRRAPGRPSRSDTKLILAHLLDVATNAFVHNGYEGTTMDKVAATAGVSKHTLYSRFPDKNALFGAVIQRLVERHQPAALPADESVTVEEGLKFRARAIIEGTLSPDTFPLYLLRLREWKSFSELSDIMYRGARAQYIDELERYISKAVYRSRAGTEQVITAVRLFLTLLFAPLDYYCREKGTPPDAQMVEDHIESFVSLFLHGAGGLVARTDLAAFAAARTP